MPPERSVTNSKESRPVQRLGQCQGEPCGGYVDIHVIFTLLSV